AAKVGFGSRAALPDINTTEPFDFLSASHARIVRRLAPCSFSSVPARHCSSVISNKSICGTAPATFSRASILPKRSSVLLTSVPADSTLLKSRSQTSGSAPAAFTVSATSFSASEFRAARTIERKSWASRIAVDRPIPWLAPVTIATEFITVSFLEPGPLTESLPPSRYTRGFLRCFQDDVHDFLRRTEQWCVINRERPRCCSHSLRHEMLGLGIDHAVFFRDQEPRML